VAHFYSIDEVVFYLKKARFDHVTFTQTVFHNVDKITEAEPVKKGYGEGAFIVVRGIKKKYLNVKRKKNGC
jgi:hypothetical protein